MIKANNKYLYKTLLIGSILLGYVSLQTINAEIILLPSVPDYADNKTTSDPDYSCFEFSYFANNINSDFDKIKFGNKLGIIDNRNNVLDNLLLLNGFVEFSDNYGIWRGNASLWLVNNFNILEDKDLTVIFGVNHESNHFGSSTWTPDPLDIIDESITSEVSEFNYLNVYFRGSILIGTNSKFIYAFGKKYFLKGGSLAYIDNRGYPIYFIDSRDYTSDFNVEILYEYLLKNKKIKSTFVSFFYEKIDTDIVKDFKYWTGIIHFNKDPLITLILRAGVNIKTEAIIYQPFISYSFSNQRSIYFMIRHELFNIGIRMIPKITKFNND